MKKRVLNFIIGFAIAFVSVSAGAVFVPAVNLLAAEVQVVQTEGTEGTVKLNKKKLVLAVKQTAQLKLTGTGKKVKWSSSDKKVAKVTQKGKVTALKKGTAIITAKAGGKKYTCKVTVRKTAISDQKASLKKGETKQLTIKNAKGKTSWKSGNKSVATVDNNGKVKAVKAGTAVITAKNKGVTLKCTVTVTEVKPASGWVKENDTWYYYDPDTGVKKTGWLKTGSVWYYLDKDGAMLHDTVVDGYYLASDGHWVTLSADYNGGVYNYVITFSDGSREFVKGINLNLASHHNYYRKETVEQALQTDALCKYYADCIMADKSLKNDLDRVTKAACITADYSWRCSYGVDSEGHYQSPYGVFCANVYTCAGSTRALGRILDYMGFDWTHAHEEENHHQWCILKMDGREGYADGQAGMAGYGQHPLN